MKTLQNINLTLLSSTIFFGIMTLIQPSLLLGTMISLFLLGVYQGFTGFIMYLSHPSRIQNQLYMVGLVVVLVLKWLNTEWLWMVPVLPLCMFFTFVIYTKNSKVYKPFKTNNHEPQYS